MKFKNLICARRNLQIQIISLKKAVKHWHQFYTVSFKKQKREEYLSIHFIKLLLPWHQNWRNTIKKTSDQYLSSVQSLSHVQLFVTPWTAALQASLSITISRSLLKLTSIESVMPANNFIHCHPFLLLPSIFPNMVFSNALFFCSTGGQSIRASASASVLTVNIPDWFPLGLTGSISLQSKGRSRVFSSSLIWKHQFFRAQPSLCPTLTFVCDYWKNHSLTIPSLPRLYTIIVIIKLYFLHVMKL